MSVLSQSMEPYEVIIGDDSDDHRTEAVVREYEKSPIRYLKNESSLGQAKNVHRLFQEAEGDYIVLLHDDDRLLDGALEAPLECFEDSPATVAAYGKQQLTDAAGNVKREATRSLNRSYYRTAKYEGSSASSIRAAVLQQFPNDGYMVRAEAAKQVGYDHPDTGDACDFAFGVELARQSNGAFYYTDTFTSQYRLSEQSVIRGTGVSDGAYWAVKTVLGRIPDAVRRDPEVRRWTRERIPVAIMRAAQNGHARDGLTWYFSRYHRHRIPTLGGLRRLGLLLYSYLTN